MPKQNTMYLVMKLYSSAVLKYGEEETNIK